MNESEGTRRQFLERCLTAVAGFTIVGVVAPIIEGCESRVVQPPYGSNGATDTFDVSSLDADGKGLLTSTKGPDGFRIVIIRQSASTYIAMSARCTHASCEVNPPNGGRLICPCHQSAFDLDGNVVQGPADRPLTKYTATYDPSKNTVTVTT
jgi:Rieske Fe-S protein